MFYYVEDIDLLLLQATENYEDLNDRLLRQFPLQPDHFLTLSVRWVDNHFDPHEEFICLCDVDVTTADTIVYYLKDTVLRIILSLPMCRA